MSALRNGTPGYAPEPDHRVPDRSKGYQLVRVTDEVIECEPSPKFLAEFPDGIVPITETRHLMPKGEDGAYQALIDTLTVFEYEYKREQIAAFFVAENRRDRLRSLDPSERIYIRDCVRAWLAEGVSPLTISQASKVSISYLSEWWSGETARNGRDWQAIWEEVWTGQAYPLAEKYHIGVRALRHFAELCGAWPSMLETADRVERAHRRTNRPRAHILLEMNKEHPSPQWDYKTIVSNRSRVKNAVPGGRQR